MSPPESDDGRRPATNRDSGRDAESATIDSHRVTDLPSVAAALADLFAAAFRYGRLSGFSDGWRQGLAANLERSGS